MPKKRVDRGIYLLAPGVYEVVVASGPIPGTVPTKYGQVCRRHRGTITSARDLRRLLIGEVAEGKHKRTSKTVTELIDAWLADLVRLERAPKTLKEYRADADRYWLPAIGDLMLHKVTRAQVKAVLTGLRDRGVTASTIHHIQACISSAWSWAMEEGWAAEDPTKNIRRPSKTKKRAVVPTPEVINLALSAAGDTPIARFVFLGAVTGARSSELRGLRVDRIDLARGYAGIDTAMSAEEEWTTKNRHLRTVGLDDLTVTVVARQMAFMRARLAEADPKATMAHDAFLFSDDPYAKVHWREDSVTKQVSTLFDHLAQPDGEPCSHKDGETCPNPGPHAHFTFKHLRKFMDTYGQELGFTVDDVADRAGHTASVAREHYSGVREATDRRLSAALAGALTAGVVSEPIRPGS